jgi:hypothetical protein
MHFGEEVEGYEIPMLNEREVRAAAGILLFFATISFANMWFLQDLSMLKWFITFFMFEFFIRVLINPSLAPTMVLGRLIVKKQDPEFVGAPQKRWAWAIGLFMSTMMFFIVVIFQYKGMLNIYICMTCLAFLYLEAVFGICVGCKLYSTFSKNKAQHCPGGACSFKRTYSIQKVNKLQLIILGSFVLFSLLFMI